MMRYSEITCLALKIPVILMLTAKPPWHLPLYSYGFTNFINDRFIWFPH